jgi:hypothetical protein
MSLKNMVVKSGATLAPTGGSDLTFADDGVTVPNGVHLTVPAVSDYKVRPTATFRYRPPTLQTDGTYTRDKKSASFTVPMTRADGKTVNCVIRIEREVDPEMSAANALDLNVVAAQMLFDADVTNFWAVGSVS